MSRRELAIIPWLALLGVMLAGGYYRLYLAEWQSWLLLTAGALLVLALGRERLRQSALGKAGPREGPEPSWLELGAQYLPLLVFLALGPGSLTAGGGTLPGPRALSTLVQGEAPASHPALPAREKAEGRWEQVSLLELYRDLDAGGPERREVEVVGRTHVLTGQEREEVNRQLGVEGVDVTLYRLLIICCAADARALALVLEGVAPADLSSDGWCRVRGQTRRISEGGLLALRVQEIQTVPEPADPYLSFF